METLPTPSPHRGGTSDTDTVTVSDTVTDTVNKKGVVGGNKKPAEDPVKELFGYNEFLLEAVEDWLKYKKSRRESYKEIALKSLMTQIQNRVAEYGEDAVVNVIRDSMAANYQGITWDRLKQQPRTKNEKRTYTFADVYAEQENANDKTGSFPDFNYYPN